MPKKYWHFIPLLVGSVWPTVLLAYDYGAEGTAKTIGYNTSQDVYRVIATVTGVLLSLIAILFFGLMLYAGVRWMTAHGNAEFAEKAEHTLIAATIGFVIVVLSYAFTRYVFKSVGLL